MNGGSQAVQVPEGLTPRHWRLIDLALWLFIGYAYDRANAAGQDKEHQFFKPGELEAFMRDAKDAEEARAFVAKFFNANMDKMESAQCATESSPPPQRS